MPIMQRQTAGRSTLSSLAEEIRPGVTVTRQKDTATAGADNPADRVLWSALKLDAPDTVQLQAVLSDGTVVTLGTAVLQVPDGLQGQALLWAQVNIRLSAIITDPPPAPEPADDGGGQEG